MEVDATEPTAIWMDMAHHFLDTETRDRLPHTAWLCVSTGFSIETSRQIWHRDVTPAVGSNISVYPGEWAGWSEQALVERIRAVRSAGPVKRLWSSFFDRVNESSWLAIERCMEHLLTLEANVREQRADDLAAIARHAFDFCPEEVEKMSAPKRERLRGLYPHPFRDLMSSVFLGGPEERDLTERF